MSAMKQIDGYKIYMNQMIGKGSFGAVYIGVSDSTGQKVAVKILSKANSIF
jgi:serine/threonine protein kinase